MENTSVNFIQIVFILIALITFLPGLLTNYAEKYVPDVFLQFFRYGRANVPKNPNNNNSFLRKIEVPKKWFYHVYIYAILIQSLILYTVITTYRSTSHGGWLQGLLSISGGNSRGETVNSSTTVLVESLFLIQLLRRLYETCFVCVYSGTKMNLMHYFLTYLHYTGCMLAIPCHSSVFYNSRGRSYEMSMKLSEINIFQYACVIIFFYGSWVQYQAHKGLASLRQGRDKKVVNMKHQIPRGGLFDTISCPNYWGEILVYSGIAGIFKLQNLTWNYVAVWVIANQITTGVMNHRWYKTTFKDYPTNRKAVIPYIW